MKTRTTCCVVLIGVLVYAQATFADEVTETALRAHKSTLQLIQQLSCRVEWEGKSNQGKETTVYKKVGRYWRDGERARAIENQQGRPQRDYFTDGSVLRICDRGGNRAGGAIRSAAVEELTHCDAYARALFHLSVPNAVSNSVSLGRLIDEAASIGKAEKKNIDGREHVVLHLRAERPYETDYKWKIDIYLDSTMNYLVRRAVYEATPEATGTKIVREYRVKEFIETAPSIFFPKTAEYDYVEGGKIVSSSRTTFTEIVVNQPLPSEVFDFRFPGGLEIGDHIRNSRYRVDQLGNRISAETPMGQRVVGPAVKAQLQKLGFPTEKESTSWVSWLPWFFAAVFILAGGRWAYLKWGVRP